MSSCTTSIQNVKKRLVFVGLCILVFLLCTSWLYIAEFPFRFTDVISVLQQSVAVTPHHSGPRRPQDQEGARRQPTPIDLEKDYQELTCQFARLDPFDPSIMKYVTHPKSIDCERVQPYDMTYVDQDGRIRANQSEWDRARSEGTKSFNCTCRTLDRHSGWTQDDNEIIYGVEEILEYDHPLEMWSDVIEVRCKNETSKDQFYVNIHVHPVSCGKREFRDLDDAPEDQLSVFMIFIDSISISLLKRSMPLTYKYLTDTMGFHVFNGYTKVGANSRPNLFPILTGKRISDEQEGMYSEIDQPDRFLDDGPELIWQRFAKLNYSTMMNEDFASYGVFHYGSRGYHRKPTDFYYHSLWMAIDNISQELKSSSYCFGNRPKVELQLDITSRHIEKYERKLQFIFAFFAELSHGAGADIERADDRFLEFFRRINRSDRINRTVIMFLADHGHRFSKVRETFVGLMEARQPMFLLRFPPWFYEKYPQIADNLRINSMRLSAPFDVYETLFDISERNFDGTQRDWNARGLSMLYPIPKNRTCAMAGIPDHYCTCEDNQPFDTEDLNCFEAAEHITQYLNRLVSNNSYTQNGTSCREWTLSNVTRAEKIGVPGAVKRYMFENEVGESNDQQESAKELMISEELNVGERLRIAVELEPGGALFEAELRYNGAGGNWTVLGEVNRLNAYGNQSWCIRHEVMRMYCLCQ